MRERIVVCLMLALAIALDARPFGASLLLFVAVRLGMLVFAP